MKKLRTYIKQLLCDHTFEADTQIKVIKCSKCEKKYWYIIKDIFPNSLQK